MNQGNESIEAKIDKLRRASLNEALYQVESIKPVKEKLTGTAFFPGGDGLYKEESKPHNNIRFMVVGQDYDNEENFNKVKGTAHHSEVKANNTTWKNLDSILKNAPIQLNECFFTNAVMGLRKENSKNTGRSVIFRKENKAVLMKHVEFFKMQLEVIKPQAIIAMGIQLPYFMSLVDSSLSQLEKVKTFAQLDKLLSDENCIYLNLMGMKIPIVFITHPSFYNSNVRRRSIFINNNGIGQLNGEAAEIHLLKEMLKVYPS